MYVSDGHKQPAVLCILKSGDRFLLLKRKKDPNQGKFTPVGGKIDPHESPLHAAVRETFEETGIRVAAPRYRGVMVETSPTDYNWICFVYLAEIAPIDPPPCQEGRLEWIDAAAVFDIPIPITDRHIYEYVVTNRPFMFSVEYDQQLNILAMREEIEGISLI